VWIPPAARSPGESPLSTRGCARLFSLCKTLETEGAGGRDFFARQEYRSQLDGLCPENHGGDYDRAASAMPPGGRINGHIGTCRISEVRSETRWNVSEFLRKSTWRMKLDVPRPSKAGSDDRRPRRLREAPAPFFGLWSPCRWSRSFCGGTRQDFRVGESRTLN